jgi:hypothetical protein
LVAVARGKGAGYAKEKRTENFQWVLNTHAVGVVGFRLMERK